MHIVNKSITLAGPNQDIPMIDFSSPHSGIIVIEEFSLWQEWYENKKIALSVLPEYEYYPNLNVVLKGDGCKAYAIVKGDELIPITSYYPQGIKPLNTEQTFALNLLHDDSIPLVVLGGAAGSGKTLLSMAYGIEQVIERKRFKKLIIAKTITPVGREIGFLKGTLEDKITPWMGSFFDNMFQLGYKHEDMVEYVMKGDYIELMPITFIQGRSIVDSIVIVDEAQNLDKQVIKQIVTRIGSGSKLILLGDPQQVFEKMKADENGLNNVMLKAAATELVGHLMLKKTVRSKLSAWAVDVL